MSFLKKLLGIGNRSPDDSFLETIDGGVKGLRAELDRVARDAADALSHHHRLEAEFDRLSRQMTEWQARARQALGDGQEDLARQALARGRQCEQEAEAMRQSVESSRATVTKLTQHVTTLRQQIQDTERHARTLIARKSAAAAQQRISDAMAGLTPADDAFSAIARYEEQVLQQEAQARVLGELNQPPQLPQPDESAVIDEQLEKLRREMGSSSP
jgi:phage shock protein A